MELAGERQKEAVFIFCILAAAYFYCSMQRISAAVVLPHMAHAYGFSASLVGFLSSLFFYSYGFLQNVWGSVNDRIGPLRACSAGIAVTGFGSLLMLLPHTAFTIGFSRVVCGVGLASMFSGIYLYAALAFPAHQYPFWVGCIMMTGNLGGVAAAAPLGILMDRLGYRGLYILLAAAAFLLSAALWAVRNRIDVRSCTDGSEANPRVLLNDLKLGLRLIFTCRPLLVITFVWTVLSAANHTLQGLWGVSWISVSSGVPISEARISATFISIGLVAGSPIGIRLRLLSKEGKRGIFVIMTAICAAWLLFLFGAWSHFPARAMGWLAFFIGVATGAGMVFCSSTIKALSDLAHTGLVLGTGNMLIYVGVIVFQWGSGVIIDRFPSALPGVYLNTGYLLSFSLITLVLVSALLSILSVPTFRKKAVSNGE